MCTTCLGNSDCDSESAMMVDLIVNCSSNSLLHLFEEWSVHKTTPKGAIFTCMPTVTDTCNWDYYITYKRLP